MNIWNLEVPLKCQHYKDIMIPNIQMSDAFNENYTINN